MHPDSRSISQSLEHKATEHANQERLGPIPGSKADLADKYEEEDRAIDSVYGDIG